MQLCATVTVIKQIHCLNFQDALNKSPITGLLQGLKILGVSKYCGGHNLPPLVEIGLTVLPNIGGAEPPKSPPLQRPWNVTSNTKLPT